MNKENIMNILMNVGVSIVCDGEDYIEIENSYCGEDIIFEFDENGNLKRIGC